MKSKLIKWAALGVAMLLALSGCTMVQRDEEKYAAQVQRDAEKDAAQVVAKVGDQEITKGEAMASLESAYEYYAAYGLTDRTQLDFLKEAVVDSLVQEKILDAKVTEMGLDKYTDEEMATFREAAQKEYDDQIAGYKEYLIDSGMTEEEAATETDKVVAEADFTVERLVEDAVHNDKHERLTEAVTKDVTVSDDDVRARYDELVEEQRKAFEDVNEYETELSAGSVIAYNPPGYRRVLNLLLMFDEENTAKINEISAQIAEIENSVYDDQLGEEDADEDELYLEEDEDGLTVDGEMIFEDVDEDEDVGEEEADSDDSTEDEDISEDDDTSEDEDAGEEDQTTQGDDQSGEIIPEDEDDATDEDNADEDTADEAEAEEDEAVDVDADVDEDELEAEEEPEPLPTLTPEDQAKIAQLKQELDAARDVGRAARQSDLDEVLSKLTAGEDFVALLEQYGEDEGMKEEPTKSEGYVVGAQTTTYVPEFVDASMALQKVGDVSEPFNTDFGIHIVYYMADVLAGPVDLTAISDTLRAQVLETAKSNLYESTVEQWKTDANVETFLSVLD